MTTITDLDGVERIVRYVDFRMPPPPPPPPPAPRPRKHPKLKPCPFCGSPAKITKSTGVWGYTYPSVGISCSNKGCAIAPHVSRTTEDWEQGRGHYSVFKEAFKHVIAKWEQRAHP